MSPDERFHSLDAARGFALLLGILLHATMSFFLGLPARDSSQSTALAVTFFVIHTFRMTLFFLIAGFFAHLAFHRRGARAFARDRAKRILVPMTAGWLFLAPLTIGAVLWGLSRTYPDAPPATADASVASQGFPLTHLWFLYYLCVFYVLALTLRAGVIERIDRDGTLRARLDTLVAAAVRSHLAPLALALPTVAILFLDPTWAVWFGIHTPDTGLMPQLPATVAFGTAFVFGWLLHRRSDLLAVLARRWALHLALAVALTTTCLAFVGPTPDLAAPTTLPGGTTARLLYVAGFVLSIWSWTFGLLGGAVRFFSRPSPVRRYLADASYWIYLVHLPIVFLLQVALMDVPLPWSIKFPAIVAITAAVALGSYHWLVRSTFLGELLNGRRMPRGWGAVAAPRPGAALGPDLRPDLSPDASRSLSPDHSRGLTPDLAPDVDSLPASAMPADRYLTAGASATSAAGPAATPPLAELIAVSKRYGKTLALDGLSLAVRPGELLAVLGPNGAGKTTAIGLWLGTLQPDDGEALVVGGSPLAVESRLGVGVMLQEIALAPMLTAREHVALTASYYRDPMTVGEAIAAAGIDEIADRRYGKLSAGQKRQVQFATAICGRPRLLFLDEPTVGLDVAARQTMWATIRRLIGEGCAIVLTTHYLEEAEALADRVAVLARGRLIALGSVADMRALVDRKHISCASTVPVDDVRSWPGVVEAERDAQMVHVIASDAEEVVQRLFQADRGLRRLEVKQASLAEAFTELTKEAA